jgi:hypothetical protein
LRASVAGCANAGDLQATKSHHFGETLLTDLMGFWPAINGRNARREESCRAAKFFFLTLPTAYDAHRRLAIARASIGARLAYSCSHVKPFGIENQLVVRADKAVPCIAGRSVPE